MPPKCAAATIELEPDCTVQVSAVVIVGFPSLLAARIRRLGGSAGQRQRKCEVPPYSPVLGFSPTLRRWFSAPYPNRDFANTHPLHAASFKPAEHLFIGVL